MDHLRAELFGFLCHDVWSLAVDVHGELGLAPGLVHSGVGCWIDDEIGLGGADHVTHLCQVHLAAVGRDDFAQSLQATRQFVTDLAGSSGENNLQAKTSASMSSLPT